MGEFALFDEPDRGLFGGEVGLPQPDRHASGHRQYGANDAIDLIKIQSLAEVGVHLSRITVEASSPA
ncbi:hypothetical protein ACFYT4_25055 [Streptomyces sp. NPDC004609]|uniref:hypothetical protein n=1 Tax=Streptomyces sp. NPDC004609 TaxID=3364704 RepID=UPI0036805DBC